MSLFRIIGGRIFDPLHGIGGELRDLWIANVRIVEPPLDSAIRADRSLDATGDVVKPCGVRDYRIRDHRACTQSFSNRASRQSNGTCHGLRCRHSWIFGSTRTRGVC